MPLIIPQNIPAFKTLKDSTFLMDPQRASTQDIRPLEILIINLMPTKIETENQLLSLLANSPLQLNISLVCTQTYIGKNTPLTHLQKFYQGLDELLGKKFDGAIVTGAPVELMEFESVKYWNELCAIFDFLRENVTSTMYICWGAFAALYHFYGVKKSVLNEKCFGIFEHEIINQDVILTNLGSQIFMPHSRHTFIEESEILAHNELKILLKSPEAGFAMARDKQDIFTLGHFEYFQNTLENEFQRDLNLALENVARPKNYYNNRGEILYNWRAGANTIFQNWLNYDVYQITPFVL